MKTKLFILISIFTFNLIQLKAQDKSSFNTYWNNGLKVESADNNFKLKMGGRLMYDMMVMSQSDSLQHNFSENYNGSEIRRARFFFSGKIYENISYKVQIEFGTNLISVKDAYIRLHKLPVVKNIIVGKFKAPIGLNTLNSSKQLTMMERASTSNFDDDRHLGIMFYRSHLNTRLSWQAGIFYPNGDNNKYQGGGYNMVARVVGLPIYEKDDNNFKLLHIGASYSYQYHNDQTFTMKLRPESHLAPKYSKFEINNLHYMNSIAAEALFVWKRLSLQGEYHAVRFTPMDGQSTREHIPLGSYYGTVAFFLTNDHKGYSASKTFFDKVKPRNNYGKDGWGAFEVAARYSHIDDDEQYVYGGEMNNVALGVNWYLNPAVKVAVNYIYSMNPAYDGTANILQTRFQVAF